MSRAAEIRAGSRRAVARAITLVESERPADRAAAQELLAELTRDADRARRIGITGVPGAGKSTFIDALGRNLIDAGHRVAVLAVDPSSRRTGGSVLGDRTRMSRLAAHPAAYVRPSPSAGALGGVARATADAMTIVAAAGFDVVIVETVGVGQSETAVSGLVDHFLLLTVPGTGDELQGIKMGVLEVADVVVVNKADGEREAAARTAACQLRTALRLLPRAGGAPPVVTASARTGTGVAGVANLVLRRHEEATASGALTRRRREQYAARRRDAFRAAVWDGLGGAVAEIEPLVVSGRMTVACGVELLLGSHWPASQRHAPG